IATPGAGTTPPRPVSDLPPSGNLDVRYRSPPAPRHPPRQGDRPARRGPPRGPGRGARLAPAARRGAASGRRAPRGAPGPPAPSATPLDKGTGPPDEALPADSAGALGWNLLREEVSLPAAVLYEERLAHNLRWMQRFVEEYQLRLAPHGKTTMTPKLFRRQL